MNGIKNRKALLEADRNQLAENESRLAFAESQLALAEQRGLTEYDSDRLGVKRGKKS